MPGGTYSTGTISVANGVTLVTGAGVLWNDIVEGDLLWPVGYAPMFVGVDVANPYDELTLLKAWPGATLVDAPYVLLKTSWKRYTVAELQSVFRKVAAALAATGNFIFVAGAEPDPELGDNGQFAIKVNAGAWKLWYKDAGVWVLQGTPVGTIWRGTWSGATAYLLNDEVTRNGSSYIAILPGTNHAPEFSPTYWDVTAAKGEPGNDTGVVTIPYIYETETGMADPGPGLLRLNNAVQNATTSIAVDLIDNRGLNFTSVFDSMFGSTSAVIGTVRLSKASDATKFLLFNVTAITSPSGFRQLAVACIGSSGATPFAHTDAIIFNAFRTGDKGTAGFTWYSGAGVPDNVNGVNGDFYFRTATGDVYSKALGDWGIRSNLIGPPGYTWYSGAGVPDDDDGANGDFYFRTATGDVYTKASNVWGLPIANLTGLTGLRGYPGGAAALPYTVDGLSTMDSDPGIGKMRFTAVPQNQSAVLRFSIATALGSPVGPLLTGLALASSSAVKVSGRMFATNNPSQMIEFDVIGVTAQINYVNVAIAVKNASAPDPFADGDAITFDWAPKGDKGDAATVNAGTTTTGEEGTPAQVNSGGTPQDRVFNFTIPRGERGDAFSPQYVVAELADRDEYDVGPVFDANGIRLSVLVESDSSNGNLPTLYFLRSIGPAVWSGGITFSTATTADAVTYDNANSGYAASDVQAAIDEAAANIAEIPDPAAMAMIFGGS